MECNIAVRALKDLKILHEELPHLPQNNRALLALDGVSQVIKKDIIASLRPADQYKGIVEAIVVDWLTQGTGTPESLIEELRKSIRPVSSTVL